MTRKNNGNGRNGANSPSQLGFEAELFKAADKLRGNMEPSDYKHVALGLIFLKYISDAFEARHGELLAEDAQAAEDRDEYLADNVFWVPKDARWSHLKANAKRPEIGTLIDDAMRTIEKDNESLQGVLLLEGVGDVLEENQPQRDMLVVAGLHVAAQFVGGFEQFGFEAEVAAVVLVFAVGHVSFLLCVLLCGAERVSPAPRETRWPAPPGARRGCPGCGAA